MPSQSFSYTGSEQTWTVPPLVDEVTVRLWGAGSAGSTGGYVEGTLPVTVGEALVIRVGGAGSQASSPAPNGSGGWNGGGDGAYGDDGGAIYSDGGGGMTDIRQGGTGVSAIVAAAGGGGGRDTAAFGDHTPGDGGGFVGGDAASDWSGGEGGTQSTGGADGGSQWAGGDAANQTGALYAEVGGGGGAGYYGGGAGSGDTGGASTEGNANSGGGGSSYVGGLASASTTTGGGSSGDGYVKIEYEPIRPHALTITGSTGTALDLAWDAPDTTASQTVEQYRIYRATASGSAVGDYTEIATVGAGTTTYEDSGLDNGERYYYRVTADITEA